MVEDDTQHQEVLSMSGEYSVWCFVLIGVKKFGGRGCVSLCVCVECLFDLRCLRRQTSGPQQGHRQGGLVLEATWGRRL